MIHEATETEVLIKETAKKIFFTKGHINASTKEIALEAGVNRALIHYYFRSRDLLFNTVLVEAMQGFMGRISSILGSEMSLREKISTFLDAFIEEKIDYPYIETFLISEMMKDPGKVLKHHPNNGTGIRTLLESQIQEEIAAGRVQPMSTEHFIVNLMSLCNYPLIAKPMLQTVFGYDEATYRNFLLDRKEIVYRLIFNEPLK